MTDLTFPWTAVVGLDDAKLALLLSTIDPALGGVLLRGAKGSAKTTLARGMAVLRGGPFVDLPLGATEERVVGSLDLAAALTGGDVRLQPGLLAAAHGGVLYIDEVNLLADHLVDVLLDVAVSGVNRVERDAVSHRHDARFVLAGSMNPEEGDLRPQLLDRFGLAVDVRASTDPAERAEAVRRRLAFDSDPAGFLAAWADEEAAVAARLEAATPAPISDELLLAAANLSLAVGAEGLRADLVLARAAAALAGWEGRSVEVPDDLRRVAPLVLAHRARRHPLDPPSGPPSGLDGALDDVLGPDPAEADTGDGPTEGAPTAPDRVDPPDPSARVVDLRAPRRTQPSAGGRRSPVQADRGRVTGAAAPEGAIRTVAPVATVAAAATRWAVDPSVDRQVLPGDLREPRREALTGNLLVLAVDASGSMGAQARMRAVKGALLGLLVDAYQRRDRVALVTFSGTGARVVLRPTGSVELARQRLEELPTSGDTPLAEGIHAALDLAVRSATPELQPLVVLVTDGRATAGDDPFVHALMAARAVAQRGIAAAVIDVEAPGPGRLGLAAELAGAMRARHLPLAELTADRLEATLRSL
jgi:magnesium chelatase subunit D